MLQERNYVYGARESQRSTVARGIIEPSIGSLATYIDFMYKLEVQRIVRNNNGSSGNYKIQRHRLQTIISLGCSRVRDSAQINQLTWALI